MYKLCEMTEKCGGIPRPLNPIALRTAKTVWSFGCSECNRVKIDTVHQLMFPLARPRIIFLNVVKSQKVPLK